jgi:hypothetical protein
MAVQFRDSQQTLSETLKQTASSLTGEKVTVRQLMELVGEQGLLFFCMVLTIPFLVPVSIPGVSTVFGAVIILISIGITMNRLPWLPNRIMQREFATESLAPTLHRGAEMFKRMDQWVRPRLGFLTEGAAINRINGLALLFGGILLIFPFGFIPFSNTFPGWAILFLAVGMLQRDGLFILIGYILLVVTVIYFGGLLAGALLAGNSLLELIRQGG